MEGTPPQLAATHCLRGASISAPVFRCRDGGHAAPARRHPLLSRRLHLCTSFPVQRWSYQRASGCPGQAGPALEAAVAVEELAVDPAALRGAEEGHQVRAVDRLTQP